MSFPAYIRASDGTVVSNSEALDSYGQLKDGYGIRRKMTMMDSASRTPTADAISIMDAAAVVFDAEPMRFGSLNRIIAEVKSPHRDVALSGARQARDQAHTLAMFADGHFRPRAMTTDGRWFDRNLTDAEKVQFRRLSDHLLGLADAAELKASPGSTVQHDAALTPDQAYAAMCANLSNAWSR